MAGRTISAANEAKLRAAMEALTAVMASMDAAPADAMKNADKEADDQTEADAAAAPVVEAALEGEIVPLAEASAVDGDGKAMIKIIAPGWGSSGYYPAEVLKRDGPNIFTAGVKGYWNHPTMTEEAERPEGSLSNLASELVGNAIWQENGREGPGLYALAKVFGGYRDAVNELAPHIGVSIRASGRTKQGEAEGRKGPIIEQLVSARSVDFVTTPGAGGKIVQMFEAARNHQAAPILIKKEIETVNEQQFKEAQDKLTEAQTQIAALQASNARMAEGLILRDAREAVGEALRRVTVPDVTRARLLAQLSANPPIKDNVLDRAALAVSVAEAVKAEQTYLAEAAGYGSGRIEGMGDTTAATQTAADFSAKLTEGFKAMGLSDAEAIIAANGR